LGGLNKRNIFLTVLEAGKTQVNVLDDWILGGGCLPGLQKPIFSTGPHMVYSYCACDGREKRKAL
jgi:hypothetical protein